MLKLISGIFGLLATVMFWVSMFAMDDAFSNENLNSIVYYGFQSNIFLVLSYMLLNFVYEPTYKTPQEGDSKTI